MKKIFLMMAIAAATLCSCNKEEDEGAAYATAVVISKDKLEMHAGETAVLTAKVKPETFSQTVVWTSLDTALVKVDNGVVTSLKTGVTYVVAASIDGWALASCMVEVNPRERYDIIVKDPDGNQINSLYSYPEYTAQLSVTTSDGLSHNFTWESDNPEAFTVTDGLVELNYVSSSEVDYLYYGAGNMTVSTEDGFRCNIPVISNIRRSIWFDGELKPLGGYCNIEKSSEHTISAVYAGAEQSLVLPMSQYTLTLSDSQYYTLTAESDGYRIATVDEDGTKTVLTMTLSNEFQAEAATVAVEKQYADRDITDFESLKSYCDDVNSGKLLMNAHIKNDITLTSQEAGQITGINSLYGIIYGENHTIEGLTTPLVGNLYGEITDLTLNSAVADTGRYVGVFAGQVLADGSYTGRIKGCGAQGTLSFSVSTDDGDAHYVGGIAGYVGKAFVEETTSDVQVTAGGSNTVGSLYLGGIAGRCDGVLSSVTNNGAVKSDGIAVGGALWQGGVAGKMSPDEGSDIVGITNNGAVTVGAASCTQGYWGGVFGDNSSTTNRNITNAGALSIGAIVPSSYFFIGGVIGNASSFGAVYENAVCTAAASITVDGTSISTSTGFALGGLFGKITNFQTVKSSSNSAPIVINDMVKVVNGRYDIGGIAGYIQITDSNDHENGTVSFADVFNAGDISFTGSEPTRSATYIRVGGLVGNALSERSAGDETLSVKDCSNSGTITLPMNASQKVGIMVGGLVAHDRFAHYVQNGSYNAGDIDLSGVNLNEKDNGMYGLHIGGNVGFICHESSAATATITGDSVNPTNSGSVSYEVTATYCAYRPAVGGIVGVAAAKSETKPLTLDITNCSNAGSLQMKMNSMPSKANMGYVYSYSYAGGILGIAGIPYSDPDKKEDEAYDDYSYVISNISNCSNSATVKWGKINSSISSSYNYYWSTYAGGILGTTRCVPGTKYKTTITSCTNTGDILSYDGCAGGIAGAIPYSGTITGTADAYTTNTGKVMKGGASKPQGQAGGIVGWTSVDDTCPDALVYSYCCNTGYVYGNNGAGGFMGRVTNFKGYTGLIHHLKLAGTVQSSTSTGNTGSFSPNDSGNIKANSDKISNIAIGGTVNGKNSAETTTTYNATDFVTQVRANFMEYKTSANNLSEDQVTSMKLQYWDGVSEPEWL